MKKRKWCYSVALDDNQFYNYLVSIIQYRIAPLPTTTSKNILFSNKTTKIKFDTKYKELGFTLDDNYLQFPESNLLQISLSRPHLLNKIGIKHSL